MHYLTEHPEVAIFAISSVVTVAGIIIRLFWRVRKHDDELAEIRRKQAEDMKTNREQIETVCTANREEVTRIYSEIDEVKQSYMTTTTQILVKLDELSKDVKTIAIDLAYYKGQQAPHS